MLNRPAIFVAILIVQVVCAIIFVSDILLSVLRVPVDPIPWRFRELMEIGAALGLVLGVFFGALFLRASLRRTRAAEEALRIASSAFMDIVEERFAEWGLTPAERDVALFALKGCTLSEIAALRDTSEGTVKAQTNAIYRKANVSGRPQFLSLFVEDLMDVPDGLPTASRQVETPDNSEAQA
ncbi:helix-turn-helix transcriptional regulator [Rhodobacterales bacterium HKCCE4037]|nr:helix-turn-helix transcriptional regulator [Rhodobacterales bacterium HKCCE4037]